MPVLRLGVPQRRALREAQFHPPSSRILLLASQPGAKGRHEIIVGQLIILLAVACLRWLALRTCAFRIRGRDKAKLTVEDTKHIFEILWPVAIARGVQQFLP